MTKIAILGGGVGALSAAFELTELDPGDEFEITVYQLGWRLGGKGAVGRQVESHNRVEEHGLHLWTGFYDNAFNLVDRCYDALRKQGDPVPFGSRFEAFERLDHVTLMQKEGDDDWIPWAFDLPRRGGMPGDFASAPFVTLVDYVRSLVAAANDRFEDSRWLSSDLPLRQAFQQAVVSADELSHDPDDVTSEQRDNLRNVIETTTDRMQVILIEADVTLQAEVSAPARAEHRRLKRTAVLIDLALALAYGVLADDVFEQGFDVLDSMEWSDWMSSNHCSPASLDSAVVQSCYDYIFGFVGDKNQRNFAAGTGTRLLLKLLFGYKGSFFFAMRATMGELLFAPLYAELRKRKVRFEFFHRVDRLVLSSDRRSIQKIEMAVQATTKDGLDYDPLISIPDGRGGSLRSWPSHPKYDLLAQGDDLRDEKIDLESAWSEWKDVGTKTLERVTGFEHVVLGVGLGAFPSICADLVAKKPPWDAMVKAVKTVPTMALQLWTTCSTSDLLPPRDGGIDDLAAQGDKTKIVSGFAKPLDTWGDLTLLLRQETWPEPRPLGLHYFVSSYQPDRDIPPPGPGDKDFPVEQLKRVKQLELAWIQQHLGKLWPGLLDGSGDVRWDLLFDPSNGVGKARLEAQYARININPSDQYVQSVAGSLDSRMTATGSGIDNLYLAGDWVRTGINAGCVEAAVMAGRAAAGAIAGVEIDMPNASDFSDDGSSGLINAALPALTALRKLERVASGGTGTIDGYCTIYSRPTAEVQSLLPPGASLQDDKKAMQDVVLVFARQRDVRPGLVPFGGLRYAEVFNIILGVVLQHSSFREPLVFSFMPHLLLDHPVPVLVGRNLYGFNKELARINHGNGAFDVRSTLGASSAQFLAVTPPNAIGQFPEIVALREKLQLPLIGQAKDGSYVISSVHWDLDAGTFQRVLGSILVGPPFAPSVQQIALTSEPGATPWGFRMQCQWRLSLPIGDMGRPSPGDSNRRRLMAQYGEAVLGKFPFRR
jgi:uncharacterized protein with NAD-binding domain and iron-sulfur cluster